MFSVIKALRSLEFRGHAAEPVGARLWSIGLGAAAVTGVAVGYMHSSPPDGDPWVTASAWILVAFGAGLLVLVLLRRHLMMCNFVALAVLTASILLDYYYFTHYVFSNYGTDSLVMTHVGGVALLGGRDPYAEPLSPYFNQFNLPLRFTTPRMDGTITDHITYPALNFLLFVPFLALGVGDLRLVLLGFQVMDALVIYILAPKEVKALAVAPFVAGLYFQAGAGGGLNDWAWVFFILPIIPLWDRSRKASGLFLGLAGSFKQVPWLVAPYLLLRVVLEARAGRRSPWREALEFLAPALAVFLVLNLPFIVWNPSLWWRDILDPIIPAGAPMVMHGSALSYLTTHGQFPVTKDWYTLAVAATGVALAALYYLLFPFSRRWVWALPGILALLDYRSLMNHYSYWLYPLAVEGLFVYQGWKPRGATQSWISKVKRRSTLVPLIALALVLTSSGLYFGPLAADRHLQLVSLGPLSDTLGVGAITTLNVTIHNPTQGPLEPLLSVQFLGWPMLYWNRTSGPSALGPGLTGAYTFSTDVPDFAIPRGEAFNIMLNDPRNPDTMSVSPPFRADIVSPPIENGQLLFWHRDGPTGRPIPYQWTGLLAGRGGDIREAPGGALNLSVGPGQSGWAIITQTTRVNANLTVTLSRTSLGTCAHGGNAYVSCALGNSSRIGVSVTDGVHSMTYLFVPGWQGRASLDKTTTAVGVPAGPASIELRPGEDWASSGWGAPQPLRVTLFAEARDPGAAATYLMVRAIQGSGSNLS